MKLKKTNSSFTFENEATAEQKYIVVATVSYDAEGVVKSINGGSVRLEQKTVANFNRYSAEQLSVTYTSALSTEEKQEITAVIDEFVVAAEVAEKSNI